ncbi:MAG TPA: adenylate/guanylate cyclase domain-containing protein [Afifellaceae bacterium]|nr:adenylate/guanylate cyclase domain-containing protein [Afifellaceae bacterium]
MAIPARDEIFRAIMRRPARSLPAMARSILQAGIRSQNRLIRRRQTFTNLVAYVGALITALHLVTNAAHDFSGLSVVNAYNVLMIAFFLLNHRLHAFGDLVAAVTLITGIAVGHCFVVFALGTSSDLHFYFTLAGFTLVLVGVENFRVFTALYALGLAALLVSLLIAPDVGFAIPDDAEFRLSLARGAALNTYVMNGVLIGLILLALHRAEQRSEDLLNTILPMRIVRRLEDSPDFHIADRVDDCSILFVDLVGFTEAAGRLQPEEVVTYLDDLFRTFDAACFRYHVDKIKTIGDSYMAVGGLDTGPNEGARGVGLLALECMNVIHRAPKLGDARLDARIGIHCGPVTAGIIGDTRVSYDVWGDSVNIASRLESHGVPGRIHVSEAYREHAGAWFEFEPRGTVEIRSLGAQETFLLLRQSGFGAQRAVTG